MTSDPRRLETKNVSANSLSDSKAVLSNLDSSRNNNSKEFPKTIGKVLFLKCISCLYNAICKNIFSAGITL